MCGTIGLEVLGSQRAGGCRSSPGARRPARRCATPFVEDAAPGGSGLRRSSSPARRPITRSSGRLRSSWRISSRRRDCARARCCTTVIICISSRATFNASASTIWRCCRRPCSVDSSRSPLPPRVAWTTMRNACGTLRVLLRYLHREGVIAKDLSALVAFPQSYRHAGVPRSMSWEQVEQVPGQHRQEICLRRAGLRDAAAVRELRVAGLRKSRCSHAR